MSVPNFSFLACLEVDEKCMGVGVGVGVGVVELVAIMSNLKSS